MRNFIGIILLLICFFFPLQFLIIGDGMGFGFQGVFYQYKDTTYGNYLLPVTADVYYIFEGLYKGRTMVSVLLWVLGSLCILVSTVIWLINNSGIRRYDRISGVLIVFSGVAYLFSIVFQYGVFFSGPAGMSVPFGIPLLFILGFLMMKPESMDLTEWK